MFKILLLGMLKLYLNAKKVCEVRYLCNIITAILEDHAMWRHHAGRRGKYLAAWWIYVLHGLPGIRHSLPPKETSGYEADDHTLY